MVFCIIGNVTGNKVGDCEVFENEYAFFYITICFEINLYLASLELLPPPNFKLEGD